jgi:glyoxylase-like metal-dependent hydrolase (beta-lactamase superfamily II)
MKRIHWLFVAALIFAGCASSSPEQAIVNDAAEALGGAARIEAVKTVVADVTGEQGNLGQNLTPDAPLPIFKVTEGKISMDFAQARMKTDVTRVPTFVTANMAPQKQVQGLDGNVGYNVGANGMATRTSEETAKDRRLTMYHHPIAAVRAALGQGAQLSNARKEGSDDVVDITTSEGHKVMLFVDSATKLPSKVVSMTSNNANWPLGDATVQTTFANYTDVDGLKVPGRITSKTDKYTTSDFQIAKTAVNGDTGDLAAPEAAKTAAVPTLTAMVTAEEVGKGLWYLAGQSHHSILVEFADHVALIEAPQNEVRVDAVLAKAKELVPTKPLRYVVNTHHHFDHSGGMRRAMAEDVTIITHAANKSFYEEIAKRPSTLLPDKVSPKAPKIEGIDAKYELKDSTRTVEIYPIPNPHSDSMLIVYFPAERLLVEADLYTPPAANAPPPPGFPFAASVVQAVTKLGLRPARLMPIHGFIVPYSTLETVVRSSVKSSS